MTWLRRSQVRMRLHAFAKVLSEYGPGKHLTTSSQLTPALARRLGERSCSIDLGEPTTNSSFSNRESNTTQQRQNKAIEDVGWCLEQMKILDGTTGCVEINIPEPSPKERTLSHMAILIPRREGVEDAAANCLSTTVREVVMAHCRLVPNSLRIAQEMLERPSGCSVRFLHGSYPYQYWTAASTCFHQSNCRLVFVTRMRLWAEGLHCEEMTLEYPQWFAFIVVPARRDARTNPSVNEIDSQPCRDVKVLLPIVDPRVDGPWSWSAIERVPVLCRALQAFFRRGMVNDPHGGMEAGSTAVHRMRSEVTMPYLVQGRRYLPQPVSAQLLHHELHWHLIEHHLGSVMMTVDESCVYRIGDDLLLPLDVGFVTSTLLPLMRDFTTRNHGEGDMNSPSLCWVKASEFFSWTWSGPHRHVDESLQGTDVEERSRLEFLWRRLEPKEWQRLESHLCAYFLYFPQFFNVDVSTMTISFSTKPSEKDGGTANGNGEPHPRGT